MNIPDEIQKANTLLIARREVMFQALKEFNKSDHKGQGEKEQVEALLAEVDKAAKGNGRLSEDGKARVALECEGLIRDDAGFNMGKDAAAKGVIGSQYVSPKNLLAFATSPEIKALVSGDMPVIPADAKTMVDLGHMAITDAAKKQDIQTDLGKDAAVSLEKLAQMNAIYEKTVSLADITPVGKVLMPLVNEYGDFLNAGLETQKVTREQIDKKKEQWQKQDREAATVPTKDPEKKAEPAAVVPSVKEEEAPAAKPPVKSPEEETPAKPTAAGAKPEEAKGGMLESLAKISPMLAILVALFTGDFGSIMGMFGGGKDGHGGPGHGNGNGNGPGGKGAPAVVKLGVDQVSRLHDGEVIPVPIKEKPLVNGERKEDGQNATLYVDKKGQVIGVSAQDGPMKPIAPVQLEKKGNDYVIGDGYGASPRIGTALDIARTEQQQKSPEALARTQQLAMGSGVTTKVQGQHVDPFEGAKPSVQAPAPQIPAGIVAQR